MANRFTHFVAAFLLGASPFPVGADDLHCVFEQRFKSGGSRSVKVQLTLVANKLEHLVVFSSYSSGREGGGYVCGIDTSEQGLSFRWTTSINKTTLEAIEDDSAHPQSVVEITTTPTTFTIDLTRASRSACGFGAEWPRLVELEKGNKKCRVTYNKY